MSPNLMSSGSIETRNQIDVCACLKKLTLKNFFINAVTDIYLQTDIFNIENRKNLKPGQNIMHMNEGSFFSTFVC
jgi:hypothetical protein